MRAKFDTSLDALDVEKIEEAKKSPMQDVEPLNLPKPKPVEKLSKWAIKPVTGGSQKKKNLV